MIPIEISDTNRVRVCKLCQIMILSKEKSLVLKDVHVSPKYTDLHFHIDCWQEANKIMESLYNGDILDEGEK